MYKALHVHVLDLMVCLMVVHLVAGCILRFWPQPAGFVKTVAVDPNARVLVVQIILVLLVLVLEVQVIEGH